MIELESPKPLLNPHDYPRIYRPAGATTIFLFVVAAVVTIGGALGVWYFGTGHDVGSRREVMMLTGISAGFVLPGLWLILYLVRFRIVLTADRIELHGLIFTQVLSRHEILGWKTIPGHHGPPVLMLVPRGEHRRAVKMMSIIRRDEAFENWIETLTNLDAEETRQSTEEIANDPALGDAPGERLAQLRSARRIAAILRGAAVAAIAWGLLYPRPYHAAILALVVLPWLALVIAWRSPGLYRIDERRNDAHASVGVPFILPGFVLALRVLLDLHVLGWKPAAWLSLGVGVMLWFPALMVDPTLRTRKGIAVLLLLFTSAYGAGAVLQANALLDKEPATVYPATVLEKHINSGRHTEYNLQLSAWGPQKEPDTVTVSRWLYESLEPGDSVCVAVRPGALHIPWYGVTLCR